MNERPIPWTDPLTVGHLEPKISSIPNPSHSGLGDRIWIILVCISSAISEAVVVDSTPEMMFLSRISINYDAKNTLADSSTTGGAIGGAYVIDILLHFACILTHFPLKTKGNQ